MPRRVLPAARLNSEDERTDVEMVPQRESGSSGRQGGKGVRPVTYLHIGAPKSGTTYLQKTLWNNRAALRDRGVLYPGPDFFSHTHAVLDLTQERFFGHEDPAI